MSAAQDLLEAIVASGAPGAVVVADGPQGQVERQPASLTSRPARR